MSSTVVDDGASRVRVVRLRTLVIVLWLVAGLFRLSVYTFRVSEDSGQVGRSGGTPTALAENG
jgi:hypothetical protein